ncbi:MAG: RNA polymerase sigma factor [Planctomycetes bacterium]|nr:RNA polymerase sigma factor [Planctomycetota bacterium]MBZ0152288.1 RNA polymerase sigma factor [Planctomycetota bacterium]MCC7397419.1 RNA polymerase sigma factor [Planctomycetota bacterium]
MDLRLGERPDASRLDGAEAQLLQRCQAGDAAAFQPLVRPHLTGLLALARRHCADPHWAEDLVQETLVRAFRGLPGFRGDAALRTWLFRILVRLAAEPSRWRRGQQAESLGELDVPDALGGKVEDQAVSRELQDRLDEAMERLTTRQRTALHLRAVEGLDYAAIGAVLACTAVAARMHVLEARRKVMARLQEHLEP